MHKFLFLWILAISAKHIVDTELLAHEDFLHKLALARSKLDKVKKPNDLTPLSLGISPEEWLMSKIIPRSKINFAKPVANAQFLTMKPVGLYRDVANSLNIGLVVGYEDGTLQIMQNNGEVLCSYELNYPPRLIATTTNYDEVKIAVISPFSTLEIFDFFMEKMKKTDNDSSKMHYELTKESSVQLPSDSPTTLIHYVKTGKKFWVIGDSLGNLSMHLINGTFSKLSELNLGPINSLDRFGQTLVFSTPTSVGLINSGTLEFQQACTGLSSITDICIDTMSSSSIVYALTDNKVLVIDTKHTQGSENFCKGNLYIVIATKNIENTHKKIICARNYFVTWGEGNARIYNNTLYYTEGSDKYVDIELTESKETILESYRIQNGGAL